MLLYVEFFPPQQPDVERVNLAHLQYMIHVLLRQHGCLHLCHCYYMTVPYIMSACVLHIYVYNPMYQVIKILRSDASSANTASMVYVYTAEKCQN